MIVEWNTHLFAADQTRYPFHPQAVYKPGPQSLQPDPLEHYLANLQRHGIDRAVLVQPEPYGDDHRLVLDSVARLPERLKCTSLFYPKDPSAISKLEDLVAQEPRVVATRFHAHRGKTEYLDSFDSACVRALWQRAGELGLVIELHIGPDYAQQVEQAVKDMPDFPVLIDHLAEPKFGTPEEYNSVLALGQYANVTMKLSGLSHFAQEPEPYLDAKPLVRQVAAAFGPHRLAWSSGSPTIVDALLDDWSEDDKALVKGLNLARLAGWVD